MNRKILRASLFAFALTTLTAGQPARCAEPPTAPKTTLDRKTREEVFEIVWSRINERFFDPKFNGTDWGLMRRRYAPQAAEAATDQAFYEVLERMLGELRQSHIGIIPPEAYADEEKEQDAADRPGTVGLIAQWVEEKPIITRVAPGSPAARAGLRPGYVLTAIGNLRMEDLIPRLRKRAKTDRDFATYVRLTVPRLIDGAVDSDVTLEYLDGDDKPGTVTLKRVPVGGTVARFGELPPMPVETEAKRLAGGIGYVRANIFMMPILEPIRKAVREMKDAPGIVLDLRGNPGGIGALANAIGGSFFATETNLGTMKLRRGNINFLSYPQPTVYRGPLVILTDEGSVSTSEILAGGFQEKGRAYVIGEATAGMVLPSVVEALPGGARLQYAFADYRTPKGILLEGRGVLPNRRVSLTRAALLNGEDPALAEAIRYINAQAEARRRRNPNKGVGKKP